MADHDPAAKPAPVPDAETQPYWDAAARRVLSLPHCRDCNRYVFPPRPICPHCLGASLEWVELSGRGTLYSFAVMRESYMKGFDAPYLIAQVEIEEQPGLRLTTNLIDCDPRGVRIGMPVSVAFEDRSGGLVVPQFKPTERTDG